MLDIVIPSKTEKFLTHTIKDVLSKTLSTTHIYPVLDGYTLPEEEIVKDPRVHYIKLPPTTYTKKRHAINHVVEHGKGKYIMSLDAHCMVDKHFDEILQRDHQDNWVQIPRRHRLDAENWCLQPQADTRPPIDYEYVMYRPIRDGLGFHGFKWNERTLERWGTPIDDTLTFQGSCWFMSKDWFKKNGFMQIEGYTGWGQEAEEISFTTWMNGGEVKVNKNTWYAHLHKGKKYGRMYWMSRKDLRSCYDYTYNLWAVERRDFVISLFEKFMPMPGWPKDWKDIPWKDTSQQPK